jgi:hypothetical protein
MLACYRGRAEISFFGTIGVIGEEMYQHSESGSQGFHVHSKTF